MQILPPISYVGKRGMPEFETETGILKMRGTPRMTEKIKNIEIT